MRETKPTLTDPQRATLDRLRRDGVLYSGDARLATVKALERRGLATVEYREVPGATRLSDGGKFRWEGPRLDWTARPVQAYWWDAGERR